jgi:hypothetical protein
MKLDFYEDPGHGWLAVPLELLERLELLDQVSSCSYMRGGLAHLEEDCDYSLFWAAAQRAGIQLQIRSRHCDNRSRIRNYDPYSPARARAALAQLRGAVV